MWRLKLCPVLEESCAGDESLRREVESLLAHHNDAKHFIGMKHHDPWTRRILISAEYWQVPAPFQVHFYMNPSTGEVFYGF